MRTVFSTAFCRSDRMRVAAVLSVTSTIISICELRRSSTFGTIRATSSSSDKPAATGSSGLLLRTGLGRHGRSFLPADGFGARHTRLFVLRSNRRRHLLFELSRNRSVLELLRRALELLPVVGNTFFQKRRMIGIHLLLTCAAVVGVERHAGGFVQPIAGAGIEKFRLIGGDDVNDTVKRCQRMLPVGRHRFVQKNDDVGRF